MRSSDLVFSVVNLLFSNTSSGLRVSECLSACDGVNEVCQCVSPSLLSSQRL